MAITPISPLFWSNAKKGAFIDSLALVMQQDKHLVESDFNLHNYFGRWNATFDGKPRFHECFSYENRHLDPMNWYRTSSGVIIF